MKLPSSMTEEQGEKYDASAVIPAASTSSSSLTPSAKSIVSKEQLEQGQEEHKEGKKPTIWRKLYDVATYVPPRCRWDPKNPPVFSMPMNILFAFAGAFTVANLYYNHPILNILADDFGVDYKQVAQIPTVMQAGYATGLLFLCPLADMVNRRAFVLGLVWFTATLW